MFTKRKKQCYNAILHPIPNQQKHASLLSIHLAKCELSSLRTTNQLQEQEDAIALTCLQTIDVGMETLACHFDFPPLGHILV